MLEGISLLRATATLAFGNIMFQGRYEFGITQGAAGAAPTGGLGSENKVFPVRMHSVGLLNGSNISPASLLTVVANNPLATPYRPGFSYVTVEVRW